jgi:hypothetical protein
MNTLTGRAGPAADDALEAHAAELDELIAAAAALPGRDAVRPGRALTAGYRRDLT